MYVEKEDKMKLCSICDKKIEGVWCKNCHRFVKSYEIADGIYFNESHDPDNDADCTYHVFEKKEGKTGSATVRGAAVTVKQGNTVRTAVGQNSAAEKKVVNKKVKIVLGVVAIYILILVISAMVSAVTDMVENMGEAFEYGGSYEDMDARRYASEAFMALADVVPVYSEEDDGYCCYYYNPEEIKALGIACDLQHFSVTAEELDELIHSQFNGLCAYTDVTTEESNYAGEYKESSAWAYFNTYRYYEQQERLLLDVAFDTATQELHNVWCYSDTQKDYMAFYYTLLQLFDNAVSVDEVTFAKTLLAAMEEKNVSVEAYVSDEVRVIVYTDKEEMAIVEFCPSYEDS